MNEIKPKINDSIVENVVDGIRIGYVEYLQELVEKSANKKISTGYRWTKSNHIDNNIEERLRNKSGVEVNRETLKNGWQFNVYVTGNIAFIQKPISYVNEESNFKSVGKEGDGYISSLSNKTNKSLFEDLKIETSSSSDGQIELFEPEINNNSDINVSSDVFYLATYNIGADKDIGSIEVYAAYNGKCIRIQDLSEANSASSIEVPRDLLDQVSEIDAKGYESNANSFYSVRNYSPLYNDPKKNNEVPNDDQQ
ncbi:MAG: hypothetical protein J6584_03280 [Lactobacillus sp.]|uniref:spr1630 family ClpXP-sensitive toxin n=1 Tax=Bombilactobacillus bombi TaxID=1303590 RepID=UPI0035E78727|nr:hypothetical protein [Lactobacillus sp.]